MPPASPTRRRSSGATTPSASSCSPSCSRASPSCSCASPSRSRWRAWRSGRRPSRRDVPGRRPRGARERAEQEAALRRRGETMWTEERLKQFVNLQVGGPFFVVSNREPVSHVLKDGKGVAQTPTRGRVTAMEPILRACGGVRVAHGSGSADRETSDERGRLGVPVDDPRYTLRRVWLTEEEER